MEKEKRLLMEKDVMSVIRSSDGAVTSFEVGLNCWVKGYQQAQKDFLTWYTTGDNKHYVGDKLIEVYKKEVLNK